MTVFSKKNVSCPQSLLMKVLYFCCIGEQGKHTVIILLRMQCHQRQPFFILVPLSFVKPERQCCVTQILLESEQYKVNPSSTVEKSAGPARALTFTTANRHVSIHSLCYGDQCVYTKQDIDNAQ